MAVLTPLQGGYRYDIAIKLSLSLFVVSTPDFSTAVGLILYGFHIWQDRGLAKDRKKGALARFKDWFKEG
jgi:hypothetical protein